MTDTTELREMKDDELVTHIKTVRKDIFGLRFQNATGELENTAGLGHSKRDLARALTIAKERGIETSNI
ncbi:MAG TPA: 50S ribosomal protein L29 [Baekduia sp.]|nr:50S ribosomal protein L29 [Baekduia sp.]